MCFESREPRVGFDVKCVFCHLWVLFQSLVRVHFEGSNTQTSGHDVPSSSLTIAVFQKSLNSVPFYSC